MCCRGGGVSTVVSSLISKTVVPRKFRNHGVLHVHDGLAHQDSLAPLTIRTTSEGIPRHGLVCVQHVSRPSPHASDPGSFGGPAAAIETQQVEQGPTADDDQIGGDEAMAGPSSILLGRLYRKRQRGRRWALSVRRFSHCRLHVRRLHTYQPYMPGCVFMLRGLCDFGATSSASTVASPTVSSRGSATATAGGVGCSRLGLARTCTRHFLFPWRMALWQAARETCQGSGGP